MKLNRHRAGRRLRLPALLVGAVAAGLAGSPTLAQEALDRRISVDSDAYIRIMNLAGTVRVIGWESDSVAVSGTVEGDARFYMGGSGGSAKLGVWPEDERESGEAHLEVRVPRTATVWVKTESAAIEIAGLSGSVDAYSVTGRIEILGDLRGIYAESMGGDVRIDASARTTRVKTAGGSITLRGETEDADLASVSGDLTIDLPTLVRGRLESVTGDIRYEGTVEKGGTLDVFNHKGTVELRLAADLSAEFELTTIEGRIQNELAGGRVDAPFRGRGRRLSFLNGDGGASISVHTFGGLIVLRPR